MAAIDHSICAVLQNNTPKLNYGLLKRPESTNMNNCQGYNVNKSDSKLHASSATAENY